MSYGPHPGMNMSHHDMLETAGRLVDKHLMEDRTSLDMSELFKIPNHSRIPLLKLKDTFYSLNYFIYELIKKKLLFLYLSLTVYHLVN